MQQFLQNLLENRKIIVPNYKQTYITISCIFGLSDSLGVILWSMIFSLPTLTTSSFIPGPPSNLSHVSISTCVSLTLSFLVMSRFCRGCFSSGISSITIRPMSIALGYVGFSVSSVRGISPPLTVIFSDFTRLSDISVSSVRGCWWYV